MSLSQQLSEYNSACFTGLWIQSHEHDDALTEIAQLCHEHQWRLATWDIAQGLQIPGQNGQADAAAGLTRYESEGAYCLSLVRHGRIEPSAVWELKSQMLKKSGLMSLHRGGEAFAQLWEAWRP